MTAKANKDASYLWQNKLIRKRGAILDFFILGPNSLEEETEAKKVGILFEIPFLKAVSDIPDLADTEPGFLYYTEHARNDGQPSSYCVFNFFCEIEGTVQLILTLITKEWDVNDIIYELANKTYWVEGY